MEDEEEIKIEYFEIDEQDPLSHKLSAQSVSCSKNPQVLIDVEDIGSTDDLIIEEPLGILIDVQENSPHEPHIPIEKEQWYKSIDSTGRYVCKFCDLPYTTVQNVRRHTQTKHPTKARELKVIITKNNRSINRCHICKDKFEMLSDLHNHMKIKHSQLNHFCHKCQAVFDNEESLTNHLKSIHNIVRSNTYMCLSCGYKTNKVSHYKQHQRIHWQYKSHKCNECNYATNNMPNLRIHIRIHGKSKKYKCKDKGCSYSTPTRSALRSHELIHNKEGNFIYCDKCTYKTVYKQSLRKHTDSHVRNTVKTI